MTVITQRSAPDPRRLAGTQRRPVGVEAGHRRQPEVAPQTSIQLGRTGRRARRLSRADRRTRRLCIAAVFVIVLTIQLASPVRQVEDSFRVNAVAQQIIDHRTVSLQGTKLGTSVWIDWVKGGEPYPRDEPYPRYPLGESFIAVPFVAGADLAGLRPDTQATNVQLQVIEASVVVAATAAVVFLIAELGLCALEARRRRRWAAGTAFVFAFGTAAWSTASRAMWQHGPSMLCLSLAAYLALRSKKEPRFAAWMGLPLGAAYFMRPTDSIPIAVLSVWILACRRRQLIGYLAGLGAMLGAFVFVSENSYHTLLQPYYTSTLSGFPVPGTSLAGELVSPARGLLVFSPVVVLAVVGVVIARRRRAFDGLLLALVAIVVAHWLTVSSANDWWGGYSYGPRYMSDMLPFLVVLALPAVIWLAQKESGPVRTAAVSGTAVLVVASVLFNLGGGWSQRALNWNNDVPLTVHRLWSSSDPQFLRGLSWVAPHADYAQLVAVLAFVGVAVSGLVSIRQIIGVWAQPNGAGAEGDRGRRPQRITEPPALENDLRPGPLAQRFAPDG